MTILAQLFARGRVEARARKRREVGHQSAALAEAWRRLVGQQPERIGDAVPALRLVAQRDEIDTTRTTAPLRVPAGAVIIASEGQELAETVAAMVGVIRAAEVGP